MNRLLVAAAPPTYIYSVSNLSPAATAALLPYPALAQELLRLLCDPQVRVPPRLVLPLAGGASLFVMPASDQRVAMTKLISYTPANAGSERPTIQGDVVVFDIASGERRLILHGPTVTARRTAAVSLLAAQWLASNRDGPLLVVGAGVQGRAHLEAFAAGLGIRQVVIASRSAASATALQRHAQDLGLDARVSANPDAELAHCPLVVTCTPADAVVLRALPRADAFLAAVGAFTPLMVELDRAICRHVAANGSVVLDTPEAVHEAGDLLQAGLDPGGYTTLREVLRENAAKTRPLVLFKSCGWAGWDLAAARLALSLSA